MKGVRLNISKSGIGFSAGIPGARFTKTATGRNRSTYSIPGTGFSYVKESGGKRKRKGIGSLFGNVIFAAFVGVFILIRLATGGGSNLSKQPSDTTNRERTSRDRNKPIEMTGRLESKTPEEVFRQTTPYDRGQSIFASWHTSSDSEDSGSISDDVVSGTETIDREFGVDWYLTSAVFYEINDLREHLGVGYLDWDEDLYYYAEIRALEILESGKYSHERPNGDMWWDLFYNDGYSFNEAAENLADRRYSQEEAYSIASDWIQIWINNPPSYDTMTDTVFTHMAACVVYGVVGYEAVEFAVTLYACY